MVTMYKLVTQDWTTHNGMKWKIGQTNKALGVGAKMCTDQVLHCYVSPEQASLFNARHANIKNPICLEIECSEIVAEDGLKYACKEQTPVKEITLPYFTTNQKIAIAIKLALLFYKASAFASWANSWLDGTDRSYLSARAAKKAAAADAAYAAADAAYAAYAAAAAADAAYAAAAAAYAAAYAAAAAAYAAAADADAYAAYKTSVKQIIEWVIENI